MVSAALAGAQPAHDPKTEPAPSTPVTEVVVTANRPATTGTTEQVQAFTAAPPDIQMARWSDRVCPVVTGLEPPQNGAIADRIVEVGRSVHLPAQVGGCAPNVLVFITDRPSDLVEALLKQKTRFFDNFTRDAEVRAALGGDRPVRWMVGTETRGATGQILRTYETELGEIGYKEDHARNSRIAAALRQDIHSVIVVVDAHRIDGLPVDAIGGYLAMAVLAQVKSQERFAGIDTVMNLFSPPGGQAVKGLTSWDRRYLAALYALDPAARSTAQRGAIATGLKH